MRRKTGYIGAYIGADLKKALVSEAVSEHRTLTQQIEHVLALHLDRRPSRRHTLVVIGHMGARSCYLDVEPKEARERYIAAENLTKEEAGDLQVRFFTFGDEFSAYDVYPSVDEPLLDLIPVP